MAAPAAVAARPGWPQPQQQASEPTPSTSGDGGGDASAAAGGLVELQSSTGRLRRGLRVVCVQCRDTRRRCDGGFPCSRCYDMCLPCRPVLERRPRGGGGGEGKPRRRQPLQQRVRYEEAAAAAAYPLLDLALSRTHPLPLVEGLLQVFAACHREQPLDRGCAVRLVRMWRWMSQLMGADVTFGAADGICQIMGIVADEIIPAGDEGPSSSSLGGGGVGGICTDAPLTGLAAARRLERAQAAIAAASARLRSGPAFARAVRSFPAGMAVHMGGIDGALPCYGSTEEWAALVKGGMELVADVVGRRTTHMLLFPRLLAPEDRPLCYRAVIRSVFSQEARRQTEFVKVFSKSGAPRLYILTTEGTEAVAGGWGLIYALEPMPTSRHVTDKPKRVFQTGYRAAAGRAPQSLASRAAGEGSAPSFPGIAGLHLSAPPGGLATVLPPPTSPQLPAAAVVTAWRASPLHVRGVLCGLHGPPSPHQAGVGTPSPPPVLSEDLLVAMFADEDRD